MYWICQGSCRVTKNVPFVTKKTQIGRKTVLMVRECTVDETLAPNESFTPQQLTIHSLEAGSSFPPIPEIVNVAHSQKFYDKTDLSSFFEELNPRDPRTWCNIGVVATSKCTIACIQFKDFITIANQQMISELISSPFVAPFTLKEIQTAYLAKMSWESHKKSVIKDIFKSMVRSLRKPST